MKPNPASGRLRLPELIAMGVGGMIGGGIFSVLGIAVSISGHAAPLSFVLGGLIALIAGYSYIRLALAFKNDGSSFTYLEHAFPKHPNIAGITGWIVVVGYVGTLALYAYTFGAYGADLLGSPGSATVRAFLSSGILLLFMIVNLRGVRSSGKTEDVIVYTKIMLLGLFGLVGLTTLKASNLTPVFNHGIPAIFTGGATIFVAFEGFELIANAVCETEDPDRNLPRGIYGSIIIASLIYIAVAVVGVGNLTPAELLSSKEYALAVAAEPVMGNAGRVLVAVAALLATSSAINATAFGASRMMAAMAQDRMMPKAFSFRSRVAGVPWVAILLLTAAAIFFAVASDLEAIATFASLTFLLMSIAVSVANFRLRKNTHSQPWIILTGIVVMTVTIGLLLVHTWLNAKHTFIAIGLLYATVLVAEFGFSERRRRS